MQWQPDTDLDVFKTHVGQIGLEHRLIGGLEDVD